MYKAAECKNVSSLPCKKCLLGILYSVKTECMCTVYDVLTLFVLILIVPYILVCDLNEMVNRKIAFWYVIGLNV